MLNFVAAFILTFLAISYVVADVETMIPLSKNAYAFQRGTSGSNVVVELYVDLSCSSCLSSWPTLGEVYSKYYSKVSFLYRIFPLPYHQQAFILSKAAAVVNKFGAPGSVFTYMDTVFAQQSEIYNAATADMTYNEVIKLVSAFATSGTGVTDADYYLAMNSSNPVGSSIEMSARYMWKYATLQNIFATPFYVINGLQVAGLETFDDWQKTLDSLLL